MSQACLGVSHQCHSYSCPAHLLNPHPQAGRRQKLLVPPHPSFHKLAVHLDLWNFDASGWEPADGVSIEEGPSWHDEEGDHGRSPQSGYQGHSYVLEDEAHTESSDLGKVSSQ
jgi:hypothetical protein